MSIDHQSLRDRSTPRRGFVRQGRIPATIAALGLSASLGLGLAPMAGAQEAPSVTDGVVSDAQITAALDALAQLTGSDVSESITGLVTGNAEIAEFIERLATEPESLASVSVTSITAEGEPTGLVLELIGTDGVVALTEIDNVDPAVTGQFGELVAQLAADLLNQEDAMTSETEAGEVGLADILEVLEALVAAVDARSAGEVSGPQAEVIAELQRRVDELVERVPELEQLASQVEEIETRLSDLIASLTGSGTGTEADTDAGADVDDADAGTDNTGTGTGGAGTGETTVNITFDEDGNPIVTITTNDGETITQTRGEADASQVADVLGVLDIVTGAEAISQARAATADLITAAQNAVQNSSQDDEADEQAVIEAQERLVEILDNAITTEDKTEREAIAAQNARIAELVVLAADANTREDLILTVDEEVTTELVARTGEQLAMSLREAIAVEMYEAGIEDEAIAAVTGVSTDEGRLQITVPIAGNQGGNGGGNGGVDDDTDGGGDDGGGADDDADDGGDTDKDTDEADDEPLTRAELLEQLAEQLREMADQLRETSADVDSNTDRDDAMTTEELEDLLREVLEQIRGADDDDALREILEGLSLEELTALNEALKASGDGDSGRGDKTDSDTDRDEATRDLISQVLGQVDNLELTTADNRTSRGGGTGSNSATSDDAEEGVAVEINDPNANQTSQSDGRPDDAPRDGVASQPVADQGQYANQAQEELAVTGSDSSLIMWALGGLSALAAALGGGAFWWKRRQEGGEA